MKTEIAVQPDLPRGPKVRIGTISIVIPALNEEAGIAATVSAIPKGELEDMGYDVQTVVVDNGSEDRTADMARQAGAEVVFEPRRGYGRAYKTGFAAARGEIVATADADHTYPLEAIPEIVRKITEENLDFVTTNRHKFMEKGAMSFQNKVGNAILTSATRVLFGLNIRDSQSGMWVFRRAILERVSLQSDDMAFSQELKISICSLEDSNWSEVPIGYRKRLGEVKLRAFRDGFHNLLHLVILRTGKTLTHKPSTQHLPDAQPESIEV